MGRVGSGVEGPGVQGQAWEQGGPHLVDEGKAQLRPHRLEGAQVAWQPLLNLRMGLKQSHTRSLSVYPG